MKKDSVLITTLIVVLVFVLMIPTVSTAGIIDSDKLSSGQSWVLSDAGVLTITGNGSMTDYTNSSRPPWYYGNNTWNYNFEDITSIVIGEGVISIGDYNFDCGNYISNVSSVSLPSTLIRIGSHAFYGCKQITSITIPQDISSIDSNAFGDCPNLSVVYYSGTKEEWGNKTIHFTAFPSTATIHTLDHNPGEAVRENEVAATCSTEGSYDEVIRCTVCGEKISSTHKTIPALNHTLTKDDAVAASCTDSGHIEGWTCGNCNKHFADGDGNTEIMEDSWVISAKHNWSDWSQTTPPTCTEKGEQTRTCSNCGGNEIEEIQATGHDFVHHNAKPTTCTTAGNSEYWFCNRCDKYFKDAEGKNEIDADSWIIHKTAHNLTETGANTASCTEAGNSAYWTCGTCGKYFSDAAGNTEIAVDSWIIPATNHNWSEWIQTKAPTCIEKGETKRTCLHCGENETEEISVTDHIMTATAAKNASCTVTGNIAYWTCSKCGKHFNDAEGKNVINADSWVIPMVAHNLIETGANPASCTEAGNSAYWTCETCGKHFSDAAGNTEIAADSWIISAAKHNLSEIVAKEATCTEAGNNAYWYCDKCNKYYSDAKGTTVIDPNSRVVSATGHIMSGITAKEATCTEAGNIAYWICSKCNKYFSDKNGETEIVENSWILSATGHTMIPTAAKAATCTETGNSAYWYCSSCGNYYSDADGKTGINENLWIIPMTDHSLSETTAKEATCTEAGNSIYWTCETCGKHFSDANGKTEITMDSRIIAASGHNMIPTPAKPATCTKVGNIAYWTCSKCGKHFSDSDGENEMDADSWVIPMAAHNLTETVANPASCTEAGNSTYWTCETCGKHFSDAAGNTEISAGSWVLSATGHTLTETAAKTASCTEAGNIAYWSCSKCGKHFNDAEGKNEINADSWVIPMLAHNLTETVANPASCTEAGNSTYWTCETCGKHFSDAAGNTEISAGSWVLSATGHTLTETAAKTASCTEAGNIAYWSCSKCGKHFNDAEGKNVINVDSWVIPMLAHNLTETVANPASCTEEGNSAYWTCKTCDKHFSDAAGSTEITAGSWILSAAGHELTETAAKIASCTEVGNIAYWTCGKCNQHFSDAMGNSKIDANSWIIPAKAHNLTETGANPASCTEAGNSAYWTCGTCGKYFSDAAGSTEITAGSWILSATGHELTETAAKTASCTTAGNSAYWFCEICKEYFLDENGEKKTEANSWIIPAINHNWSEWSQTKSPTCTEKGETKRTCSNCNEIETKEISATGHHTLTATFAKESTCTEAGNIAYWTCNNCGKTFGDENGETEVNEESRIIAASGHNMTPTPAKSATCTEAGNSAYWTCSNCGKTFSDANGEHEIAENSWISGNPLGHQMTEHPAVKATCETPGNSAYWSCDRCGRFFSDAVGETAIEENSWVINASGHRMKETVAKEATCTTDGNIAYWSCETCGNYYKDADGKTGINENLWIIPMKGHRLSETPAGEATCTEAATCAYWTCDICGKTFGNANGDTEIAENSWIVDNPLGHQMTEHPAVNATCKTPGNSAYWSCDRCGKFFSDADGKNEIGENSWVIDVLGHKMTAHSAVDASCKSTGNSAYWSCDRCGKYFSDENGNGEIEKDSWILPATGHDMTATPAKKATCTEAGNIAYWTCETCGKHFSDAIGEMEITAESRIITATGHNMTLTSAKSATCTEAGNSAYWFCNRCDKYFSNAQGTDAIEENSWISGYPLGHHMTKHPAVKATCETPGNSTYWSCDRCGEFFGDAAGENAIEENSWVINAIGHSLKATAAKAETCTTDGNSAYWTCETCGNYYTDADGKTGINENFWIIPMTGHHLSEIVAKEATCTEEGNSAYWTCETCGKHFSDAAGKTEIAADSWIISAAKHNLSETVAKEATCTEAGNNAYWFCDKCGKYFSDAKGTTVIDPNSRVVSATGHVMSEITAKEATCTEEGNKAYWICRKCNKYFDDKNSETEIAENSWIISATGHTMTPTAAKAATCTETGNYAYWYCSSCGNYYSDADGRRGINENFWIIPMTGHHLSETAAKEATCTEAGNSTYWTCETCGKHFIDANSKTEITMDSRIIPASGHNMTLTPARPATCTEDGNSAYWYCLTCGNYYSDADGKTGINENFWIIPMTGHHLSETTAKEATCTKAGNNTYWTCETCGKHFSDANGKTEIATDSRIIAALGHNMTPTPAKPATCTETGNSAYWYCATCGNYYCDADGKTEINENSWIIPMTDHHLSEIPAKEATCTNAGNSAYWTCDICDNYFSDADGKTGINENFWIIPMTDHCLSETPAREATCTEAATCASWTCENCGKTFSDANGDTEIGEDSRIKGTPLGHRMTKHPAVNATCETPGNSAYWSCDRCGKFFSDAQGDTEIRVNSWIITADHVPASPVVENEIPATCTDGGSYEEVVLCSICSTELSRTSKTTEAVGHTPEARAAVKATCTAAGTKAYWECNTCHRKFSDEACTAEIDYAVPESALGHQWGKTTYTWSNDYQQVTAERRCSRDAAHTQKETVGTDAEVTAEATYDAPGSKTYTTRPFANADFVQQTKTVEIPKLDRTTGTGTEQPGQPGQPDQDPGNPPQDPGQQDQEPGNPPQNPGQQDQEPGNPPQDPGQQDQEPGNPPHDPEQQDQESGDPQQQDPEPPDQESKDPQQPESEQPQTQEPEQPQDPEPEQPQPEQTQPEQPQPAPESPQQQEQPQSEPPQTQPQPELPQTLPEEQPPQQEQQPKQEQPKAPTKAPTGSFTDPATGRYNVDADGNATFKSPAEDKASASVPDTINVSGFSVPVTKIDNNAFANSKQLETVTIGRNVKDIGSKAFSGCAKLKTVKGAANVEEIGKSAFASDKALKSVPKFPKLKKIGNNAFKGCTSLTKIIIGKSVIYIGKNAFNGCANLKTINIKSAKLTGNNVKSGAFKGIFAKGTIKCPKSVIKEYKQFLPKKGVPKTVTIK